MSVVPCAGSRITDNQPVLLLTQGCSSCCAVRLVGLAIGMRVCLKKNHTHPSSSASESGCGVQLGVDPAVVTGVMNTVPHKSDCACITSLVAVVLCRLALGPHW